MNLEAYEVAQRLGITMPVLRRMRKDLAEGTDWMMDGHRVLFSETGVEKLRASFESPAEKPAAASQLPQGEPENGVRYATVVSVCKDIQGSRRHFPNPCVIKARLDSGELITVGVKNSRTYNPRWRDGSPMVIKVRPGQIRWMATEPPPRERGMR